MTIGTVEEWESLSKEEKLKYLDVAYTYYHTKGYFKGSDYVPEIMHLMTDFNFMSLLDYGAGRAADLVWDQEVTKKILKNKSGRTPKLFSYEPFHTNFKYRDPSVLKKRYDIVVCMDVLEHLLPEDVDDVLRTIMSCAHKMLFLVIHTTPATKLIKDEKGNDVFEQSLHTTVEDSKWWQDKIKKIEKEISRAENRGISILLRFGA